MNFLIHILEKNEITKLNKMIPRFNIRNTALNIVSQVQHLSANTVNKICLPGVNNLSAFLCKQKKHASTWVKHYFFSYIYKVVVFSKAGGHSIVTLFAFVLKNNISRSFNMQLTKRNPKRFKIIALKQKSFIDVFREECSAVFCCGNIFNIYTESV